MAASILSGTVTPIGNYTLYTNNTGQNVRLIIHTLFVYGRFGNSPYSTRRVNITGGSHGTLQLPISVAQVTTSEIERIRIQVGKDLATHDHFDPNVETATVNSTIHTILVGGVVSVVRRNTSTGNSFVSGPQSFPTEIMLRSGQSIQFEASSSTLQQYISFNITVMPEGG
jgi:hypothetical protein